MINLNFKSLKCDFVIYCIFQPSLSVMLSTLGSKAESKLNAQWFYFGDQPNAAKERRLINSSRESQIEPTLSSLPFQRQANMNGDSLQHS